MKTPYYLIDENKLLTNLSKIKLLYDKYEVKSVLALKCFSAWNVFPLMSQYMHGTTSSSYNEVRLGAEKFKRENHAYSVAYSEDEIKEIVNLSDKIIFNSISQFNKFEQYCDNTSIGIRINPGLSYSDFDLADPNRKFSRLGVYNIKTVENIIEKIDGIMLHFNCENSDLNAFEDMLNIIEKKLSNLLTQITWLSLGGGIEFTKKDFKINRFGKLLKNFADKYELEIYLEPGEAAITNSATLVTSVLDIVDNNKNIAIINSSAEAHMTDLLMYKEQAKIKSTGKKYSYQIAGNSCLAGDIFGEASFNKKLKVGDEIIIEDAAGYTMVKKNWFNGVNMPSIAIKRIDGSIRLVKKFTYNDFIHNLS